MENFEFFTPTRMIFGKNTHQQVGKIVKEYGFKKVLVHFGGSSAKKSGLLDAVTGSLESITLPPPTASTRSTPIACICDT